jgi:probable phosphoglycerate mutase
MRLVLLRHGQTQWNAERRIHGWLDSPLTAQAKKNLTTLMLPLLNNPLIYSSDLGRAYASAAIISNRFGVDIIIDKRLRERKFGILQGRVIDQDKHLQPYWSIYHQRYIHKISGLPGVESEQVFASRISSFLNDIDKLEANRDIIIVGHGESLRSLDNIIHGLPSWQQGKGLQGNALIVVLKLPAYRG